LFAEKLAIDGDRVRIDEGVREWEYGLYEGLKTKAIRDQRKSRGLDREKEWDIWRDGCEEGESPAEVSERLDRVIGEIRELQKDAMHGEGGRKDVLVVAHGHILRAFAKRFLGYPLAFGLSLMVEPGAIGVLRFVFSTGFSGLC
jgi:sedoheptulose-bisphosphatase